ncbi:MAG: hypothetical protein KGI38_08025 [Thaumarchaeota archaeon]|nr:hypothetical protein [Nitrososphaerota archaeon]
MRASGPRGGPRSAAADPRHEIFIEKVSRSIAELQSNVNNLADVMVFLEVLGYNDRDAKNEGFADLFDLAQEVYQRVDYYDEAETDEASKAEERKIPVPSARKRLIESLSLATPWLGALALLYAFGVSLWLAWGLPIASVTALMVGVLLGLLISEGPLQAFTRIFMFYQAQGNMSECSRALKRSYFALVLLLAASVGILVASSVLLAVPPTLTALAAVGAVTISLHRIGFLPIYALKKTKVIVVSYGIALPLLAAVYFLTPAFFPDLVIRYLVALGAGLSVLSVFAWYYSTRSLVVQASYAVGKDIPSFYKPAFVNVDTIRSRFSVQFWEALPQYLFGTFFFVMIFGDRVLSWIANPVKAAGGVVLPMLFNSVYHAGADLALGVMFPVAIVQYVLLSSIHEELNNLSLDLPVTNTEEVDSFIRGKHARIMIITLGVAGFSALLAVLYGPILMARVGGSPISIRILYIAAVADIFLSVFVVNSSFIMLLNRPKTLAALAGVGASVVVAFGVILMPLGFQFIVYSYLAACFAAALGSTVVTWGLLRSPSSLFYSRFI